MPLDTSDFGSSHAALALGSDFASLRRANVILNPNGNLGAALREAREHLGLAVMDIASVTRVRAAHLGAIEAFDLDRLPARPFTVGYVRAYASALGLDGDAVAARFRDEAPRLDGALRAPCGIHRAPRRLGWLGVAGLLIVSAVLAWNLFRHAQTNAPRQGAAVQSLVAVRIDAGPAHLGAPLPPPPEAASPPAYETPGLAPIATAAPTADADIAGAPFVAAGAIFGAAGPRSGPDSGILLQAKKPTTLIVRGPGGAVYFARELATGEAWRAPPTAGLTVDVGNPGSMEVFDRGIARGMLSEAQTPLARLAG